jgi:hypothetical protein
MISEIAPAHAFLGSFSGYTHARTQSSVFVSHGAADRDGVDTNAPPRTAVGALAPIVKPEMPNRPAMPMGNPGLSYGTSCQAPSYAF